MIIVQNTISNFENLFILNSKKYKNLEELSEVSEEFDSMKNIFGVLSDAFCNSGNALKSLSPILKKIISEEEIMGYRDVLKDKNEVCIFNEKIKKDFTTYFQEFINNMYQISSLIVRCLSL